MKRLTAIAAVLALALMLAACGGSDDQAASPASPAGGDGAPLSASQISDLVATGGIEDWAELSDEDKNAVVNRYLEVAGRESLAPEDASVMIAGIDAYASDPEAEGLSLREVLDTNADLLSAVLGGGFDTAACEQELGDLITSLEEVESRLAIGLPYADYRDRVADARVAYDRIDFGELEQACVSEVGVFVEQGLNRYQRAATRWGNCIADFDCDTDSIDPALQREWNRASDLIDRSREALDS